MGSEMCIRDSDGVARIRNSSDGTVVRELAGHAGPLRSVAWSPDNSRIATGSLDHSVKLWNPKTGRESLTLRGHTAAVMGVYWFPDGDQLVSRDQNGDVRFWNATPGLIESRALATRRGLERRAATGDDEARRLLGEVLARHGDLDAAASEFAKLNTAGSTHTTLIPAGWWIIQDKKPTWHSHASDPNGYVVFPALSATAVSRIFATHGNAGRSACHAES